MSKANSTHISLETAKNKKTYGACTIKHGMSKTRIYFIWKSIKSRCDRPKDVHYKEYGGRGISYDPKWSNFEEFYSDMKDTYSELLTIDRIDNNGNYCKENCRWVTSKQQSNNRRNNRVVTINGITKTLQQWSEETNIKYNTLIWRLNNGWEGEKLIKASRQLYTN